MTGPRTRAAAAWHQAAGLITRARHGRPARIVLRAVLAAAGILTARLAGGTPAAPALQAGCALWWALTLPPDLAPPPGP